MMRDNKLDGSRLRAEFGGENGGENVSGEKTGRKRVRGENGGENVSGEKTGEKTCQNCFCWIR
jgi:hypothetical protein